MNEVIVSHDLVSAERTVLEGYQACFFFNISDVTGTWMVFNEILFFQSDINTQKISRRASSF